MPHTRVRALFATGKAMPAPLIGHDNAKRTVTFGASADGPTEGAYRTARLYSRVGIVAFGIPAAILTLIAIWLLVDFASDLAATWPQVFKFSAIAVALGLASTGLPVWAGLLARSNAAESRLMMITWAGLLALAGLAMLFFVLRMDAPQPLTEQATARAAELRKALRFVSTAEYAVWKRSDECQKPRDADDQATCDAVNARDAGYRAELAAIEAGTWRTGWTPRDVLGTGHVAGMSDLLRRLLAAVFTLLAMAGAGVLARWGAMGHAEAFRQADGIVAPPPAVAVPAGGSSALVSPLATTDLWFQGRVHENAEGRLSPTEAYDDYMRACAENGLPHMQSGAFFSFLAAKAKASGGKVFRLKSGSNFYAGWSLGEDDKGALPDGRGELLTLPYRS
jgi:hypothetical protein